LDEWRRGFAALTIISLLCVVLLLALLKERERERERERDRERERERERERLLLPPFAFSQAKWVS